MSEVRVRLPDGKTLSVPVGSTVLDVAQRDRPGPRKAALAGRIDGELVDLRHAARTRDVALEIVTGKDPDGAAEVIRHSAEHVMADAVKRLFPDGPGRRRARRSFREVPVRLPGRASPSPPRISSASRSRDEGEIVAEKSPFERVARSRPRGGPALFTELGEELKVSRLDDIPEDARDHDLPARRASSTSAAGPTCRTQDQIGAF